jgi:hypothetical protein
MAKTIPVECPRCGGTGQDPELFDGDYHDCWDCENNRRIWIPLEQATVAQLQEAIDEEVEERDQLTKSLADCCSLLGDLRAALATKEGV